MPVTQWLFDPVPRIDPVAWRLRVTEPAVGRGDLEPAVGGAAELGDLGPEVGGAGAAVAGPGGRATGRAGVSDVAVTPAVGATAELDLTALAALPHRSVRAVLDCTGGWWAEQEWRGVPLSALIAAPAGGSVDVVSATGYRRRLPARDLDALLLATSAAGRPLSAGHGGPARLVAPGRRGFWWVKWVIAVEAVDAPWWRQPPFPLQ